MESIGKLRRLLSLSGCRLEWRSGLMCTCPVRGHQGLCWLCLRPTIDQDFPCPCCSFLSIISTITSTKVGTFWNTKHTSCSSTILCVSCCTSLWHSVKWKQILVNCHFQGRNTTILTCRSDCIYTWALFVVLSDIKTREAVTSSRWNWTLITNFVCFSCLMTYEPPILPPTALWATRGAHLPPLDVQFRKQFL